MRTRKWTPDQLLMGVKKSKSLRQLLQYLELKPAGGNYAQIKKYIKENNIDAKHFQGKGWSKGMQIPFKPKIPLKDILRKDSSFQSYKLKKRLFLAKMKLPQCEECGWNKKAEDGRIPLELDHINGDSRDNRLENLRILCPNCHSLKSTHRGKNRKKK